MRCPVGLFVGLGEESGDSAAVVRFAARQTPVSVMPGSLRPTHRRPAIPPGSGPPFAIIEYDISPDGRISGMQVLRSTTREIGEAIAAALELASFTPAQSNCRPIARSVVQRFGG